MKDRNDILNNYVTDMAAVEGHIEEAVERQLESDDTARYPDAVRVLTSLRTALQRHIRSLEQYNETTPEGGVKEAVKEAVTGALGVAAGFYDQIRGTDKVSRMLRDSYTATSLAAISYHMLYTSALALKADSLAQLAIRNLKDLTPIPRRPLEGDLHGRGRRDGGTRTRRSTPSVGSEAVRATQEAWSADTVEG